MPIVMLFDVQRSSANTGGRRFRRTSATPASRSRWTALELGLLQPALLTTSETACSVNFRCNSIDYQDATEAETAEPMAKATAAT
jgi:hypothetical protein